MASATFGRYTPSIYLRRLSCQSPGTEWVPTFRRLTRQEYGALESVQLDPDQTERFLGPVSEILDAVRRGPNHAVVAIEVSGIVAGFFVLHPQAREPSCWWLGWIAIDRRRQGCGYGRIALQAVGRHLRQISSCRRVRLLVAPDNIRARRLYEAAGFRQAGVSQATRELILELILPAAVDAGQLDEFNLIAVAARARRVFRHWRLRQSAGPHAAWVIGVERGPPTEGGPAGLVQHLVVEACPVWLPPTADRVARDRPGQHPTRVAVEPLRLSVDVRGERQERPARRASSLLSRVE